MAIILWFEVRGQSTSGVTCGLVSGIAYAGVVMSLRALRKLDTAWLIAVSHLATAAIMFPYVAYLDVWPSARQFAILAAFGALQMALPYTLFGAAAHRHVARSDRHRAARADSAAAVGLSGLVRSTGSLDAHRRRPDSDRPRLALRRAARATPSRRAGDRGLIGLAAQIRAIELPLSRRMRRRISSALIVNSTCGTLKPLAATTVSIVAGSLVIWLNTLCSRSLSSSSAG